MPEELVRQVSPTSRFGYERVDVENWPGSGRRRCRSIWPKWVDDGLLCPATVGHKQSFDTIAQIVDNPEEPSEQP